MRALIRHPGPLRHVPPRAHLERLSFDAMETEADIPEVSADELPVVGSVIEEGGASTPLASSGDALWAIVGGNEAADRLDAGRTLAMLGGGAWDQGRSSMPLALRRSPLHAPGPSDRANRGRRVEPSRVGAVRQDFRDAARDAVRSYAAADLRMRAGMLWARLPGPVATRDCDDMGPHRLSTKPNWHAAHWLDALCAPDMLDVHCAFHTRLFAAQRAAKAHRRIEATDRPGYDVPRPTLQPHGVPGPLPDARADLIRFNAHCGVLLALDGIDRFLRTERFGPGQPAVAAAYRTAEAEIRRHEPLASIGAIPADRQPEVIEAVCDALSRAEAALPNRCPSDHWVTRPRAWLSEVVRPYLAAAIPHEDEAALGRLACP